MMVDAMRFHGGTKTGRNRSLNAVLRQAIPSANSLEVTWVGRAIPYSAGRTFRSPGWIWVSWLAWANPCWRTTTDVGMALIVSATSGVSQVGTTATPSGSARSTAKDRSRSKAGSGLPASSSLHQKLAWCPWSTQASSSATKACQATPSHVLLIFLSLESSECFSDPRPWREQSSAGLHWNSEVLQRSAWPARPSSDEGLTPLEIELSQRTAVELPQEPFYGN